MFFKYSLSRTSGMFKTCLWSTRKKNDSCYSGFHGANLKYQKKSDLTFGFVKIIFS